MGYQMPDFDSIDPTSFKDLNPSASLQPDYIKTADTDDPRSWSNRMMLRTGLSYVSGLTVGGGYGFLTQGSKPSHIRVWNRKLRWNAMMNGATKYGCRSGNALGALALIYTTMESVVNSKGPDFFKTGHYGELYTGMSSAALSGLLFKSTRGIKAMSMATVLGAAAFAGYYWASHTYVGKMDFASFVDKHIDKYRHHYRG